MSSLTISVRALLSSTFRYSISACSLLIAEEFFCLFLADVLKVEAVWLVGIVVGNVPGTEADEDDCIADPELFEDSIQGLRQVVGEDL